MSHYSVLRQNAKRCSTFGFLKSFCNPLNQVLLYTMLRSSVLRAAGSTSANLPSLTRQGIRASQNAPAAFASIQARQAHAISNPTLANIEKRWEAMPPQEQADLWMSLRDRMKVDWNELTVQEKKAGTWIRLLQSGSNWAMQCNSRATSSTPVSSAG